MTGVAGEVWEVDGEYVVLNFFLFPCPQILIVTKKSGWICMGVCVFVRLRERGGGGYICRIVVKIVLSVQERRFCTKWSSERTYTSEWRKPTKHLQSNELLVDNVGDVPANSPSWNAGPTWKCASVVEIQKKTAQVFF